MKLSLRIGSEKSLENRGDFIDATAAMLMKGTKNLSEEQINDTLAKMKAEVGISSNGQVVNIDISTTRDNLVPVMTIVKQILREPSFPKAEFEILGLEESGTDSVKGKGKLTLKGITKEYSFVASIIRTTDSEKFSGSIKINRKDYGMVYQSMMNPIEDIANLEFTVILPLKK